jgi:hypothetical protein
VVAASATLRDVTDLLLTGVDSVAVVDASGKTIGGADFASIRRAVAAAQQAETGATNNAKTESASVQS